MADEQGTDLLEQIDRAIGSVPELAIRRIDEALWERRSAQVWYRITAQTGPPLEANQAQVSIGIVVPLIERIVGDLGRDPRTGTIGGNLLHFSTDAAGSERTFTLVPAGRYGKLAARLRQPILGDPSQRMVTEGDAFVADLAALLRERMVPWVRITTWGQVAEALATYGPVLAENGLVDQHHRGIQGVLRWANGAEGVGEALITEDLGDRAPAILQRLHQRFAPQAPS